MDIDRSWQNWNHERVAQRIDAYWRMTPDENAFRSALVAHLVHVLARGDILEVGCGSGLIYEALERAGLLSARDYLGGDVTTKMLDIARQRFPQAAWRALDIYDLRDLRADNVLCVHVLQHLPDYHEPILNLLNATRRALHIAAWFGGQDEIKLQRDQKFSDGQLFYVNVYGLTNFLTFLRAQSRVQRVEDHAMSGLVHMITAYVDGKQA